MKSISSLLPLPLERPMIKIIILILLISASTLVTALIMQFSFGLVPCVLCLYQRIPYAIAIVVSVIAILLSPSQRRILILLCGIAYMGNVSLAFYQLGVENHRWAERVCTTTPITAAVPTLSLTDLQYALEQAVEMPCDVVQWSLFGLSLSGYNFLISLGLAVICLAAASRKVVRRTYSNV